jgi:methanogenic corrinoid protein MtbC1
MSYKNSIRSNIVLPHKQRRTNFECQSSILSIVEAQIIPRLLVSKQIGKPHLTLVSSSKAMPSQKEIETFTDLCVSESSKDAQSFVDDFLDTGLSTEDIFLGLLTPAAKYLGSQWDDDRMDFSQVNLGLVRLHSIANEIRCTSKSGQLVKDKAKCVMIASAPGSMHMLGTTIVADFFRKEDWQVVVAISSSANELVKTVSNEWFDVLGLSLSIDQQLTGLADLIDQFKSLSLNPRMVVMLGGPIFSAKKLDAKDFGAHGICDNAKHAVGLAVSLLPID